MFGFGKQARASVSFDGAVLHIARPKEADILMPLSRLTWTGFIEAGDEFTADRQGWWLLVLNEPDNAVAMSDLCAPIDVMAREGPLANQLNARPVHHIMLGEWPSVLRRAVVGDGVVVMDADAVATLRAGGEDRLLPSTAAAPMIL